MTSEATPFNSASCFSKDTKQPNKNVYPLVSFCGIHTNNRKKPCSLSHSGCCRSCGSLKESPSFQSLFIKLKGYNLFCEYIIKDLCFCIDFLSMLNWQTVTDSDHSIVISCPLNAFFI